MNIVEGRVSGITFSNETTSYYVIRLQPKAGPMETIRGTFIGPKIQVGSSLRVKGNYESHPKYGRQLSVLEFEIIKEHNRDGIIRYLTNYVPSIGPVTAGKLFTLFGVELLEILEKTPDRIHEAQFLTKAQRDSILAEWSISSISRTLSVFLISLGLNSNQVKSVLSKFDLEKAENTIKENPYVLAQCAGIGFVTADSVAMNLGIDPDSPFRVMAIIEYAISDMIQSNGHVWVLSKDIRNHISDRIFKKSGIQSFSSGRYVPDHLYYKAISDLEKSDRIVFEGDKIYLKEDWVFETESANYVKEKLSVKPFEFKDIDGFLAEFQARKQITLAPEQLRAIDCLKESRFVVISGYPGTGKTLVTSAIVELFEKHNLTYSLMSPTGIAAKRMSQVTGRPAATIHRSLGYKNHEWTFNARNKYMTDAVIVDESSMVDLSVFHKLISALPSSTILVMVGDAAQLPSVRNGDVLRSLHKSLSVPYVQLENIFRQGKTSDIVKVAHQMLRGESIDTSFQKGSEVLFINTNPDDVILEIKKLSALLKEKGSSFQIMAPVYDGDLGVNNLNCELRNVLNQEYDENLKIKNGDSHFYEGDRVMVSKNNYDRMLFNGDTGKINKINIKTGEVEVKIFDWFDQDSTVNRYHDQTFVYKIDEFRSSFRIAYVTTVHRCLSPNTIVETPSGLCRIVDIPDTGEISTPNGRSGYINKVSNPEQKMLRVTTRDGYELEMTLDHGIEVWDPESGTYVRKMGRELSPGDTLSLRLGGEWTDQPYRLLPPAPAMDHYLEKAYTTPSVLNEDMAEFLGIMTADGTLYEAGFRVVKSSSAVLDRFFELCVLLFGVSPKRKDHSGTGCVEVNSRFLSRWLMQIPGIQSNRKFVSDLILSSSLRVQSKFLRGLFENGTVSHYPQRGLVDRIELLIKEKSIFSDVKVMLLRFGIITGFGVRKRRTPDGHDNPYHTIYIYGSQVRKFANLIGFIDPVKKSRSLLPYGKDQHYQVPVSKYEALSIRNANGGNSFFTNSNKNVLYRQRMSRHQLSNMLDRVTSETDESIRLRHRLNFHHSKIKSIDEFRGPSFCVEVPDGNKFIQNGFCGYNCQGNEYDFVILPMTKKYGIMLYRNLVYTALTRAKKKVFVFGDCSAFQLASNNERDLTRNTSLHEYIDSTK